MTLYFLAQDGEKYFSFSGPLYLVSYELCLYIQYVMHLRKKIYACLIVWIICIPVVNCAENISYLIEKSKKGDAEAQYALGMRYYTGNGAHLDYDEAVKWFRLAAMQGNAEAQSCLGSCYGLGQGVSEDLVRAYAWLMVAEKNGRDKSADLMRLIRPHMTKAQVIEGEQLAKTIEPQVSRAPSGKASSRQASTSGTDWSERKRVQSLSQNKTTFDSTYTPSIKQPSGLHPFFMTPAM